MLHIILIHVSHACLENPMDGGTWQATVHGVTKSQTQLSNFTFTFSCNVFFFLEILFAAYFIFILDYGHDVRQKANPNNFLIQVQDMS